MSHDLSSIVEQTIQKIKTLCDSNSNGKLNKYRIQTIQIELHEIIEEAFDGIIYENDTAKIRRDFEVLRAKLLSELHDDRINTRLGAEVLEFLENNDLLKNLRESTESVFKNNLELYVPPSESFQRFMQIIFAWFNLYALNPDEGSAREKVNHTKIYKMLQRNFLPIIWHYNLSNEVNKYPTLFKPFIKSLYYIANIIFFLSFIATAIVAAIPLGISFLMQISFVKLIDVLNGGSLPYLLDEYSKKNGCASTEISLLTQHKLLLKYCFSIFPPDPSINLSMGEKVLFAVSFPLRVLVSLLAFVANILMLIPDKIISLLTLATFSSIVLAGCLLTFTLNLPRWIVKTPGWLYDHRASILSQAKNFFYQQRYSFAQSLIMAAVLVGLTFATFGLAPALLGIAGGISFLATFVFSQPIFSGQSLLPKLIIGGLLALGVATAVALTIVGGGVPAIAIALPFVLPKLFALQAAIVIGASIVTTGISSAISKIVSVFNKAPNYTQMHQEQAQHKNEYKQNHHERPQQEAESSKEKTRVILNIDGEDSYKLLFKNRAFAESHVKTTASQNSNENPAYQYKEVILIKSKTPDETHYKLKNRPQQEYSKVYPEPGEQATGAYQLKFNLS